MAATTRELPKTIGRYEVVRLLGTGAMGRVLLARDPVLGREVAIKILRSDLAIAEDVREGLIVRMRHEAQAAARVTHPHLVILHDMGEDERLGLYLVFEFLEGPTLRERISDRRLSVAAASKLAGELGGALAFAHARGVLHRDVKPDNIILTPTGAKIADFGIARVPDSTLTHAGGLLGTPAYSAPETFQRSVFSPASDQFSLASTLYEAISGERAFPGDDAVLVAARIASTPPDRFAERLGLRPELDDVLTRGMAPRPEDRYESCAEFGEALVRALAPNTGERTPASGGRPSSPGATREAVRTVSAPPPPRRPWQVLLGGLVVVVTVALLVRALLRNRDAALAEPQGSAAPARSMDRSASPPSSSAPVRGPAPPHGASGRAAPPQASAAPTVADPPASAAPSAASAPAASTP
ncbi:MAG: serine/threonine-protein kinase [Polyangiaceae bacterium]